MPRSWSVASRPGCDSCRRARVHENEFDKATIGSGQFLPSERDDVNTIRKRVVDRKSACARAFAVLGIVVTLCVACSTHAAEQFDPQYENDEMYCRFFVDDIIGDV